MTFAVVVALMLSTLLNLGVALRALRARREPDTPLSMSHVWRAGVAVCIATALEVLLLMAVIRLGPFGMIHMAWLTVSVVVPACGLAVLSMRVRGRVVTALATAVAVLSLLMLPIAVKAQWIDPYDLRVERARVSIDAARAGREAIVVGVLADLQTTSIGPHEEAAVTRLMEAHPDLLLIPGDLFQGLSGDFDEVLPDFRRLISRLSAPGGVWVVPGNTDYRDGLRRMLEGTGARLPHDEVVRIRVRDRQITLFGADEVHSGGWVPRIVSGLADFEAAPGTDDIRILLAHRPRILSQLEPDTRVDLVVAGHTHGGQVSLPLLGPPLVLSPLPRSVAAGGLHDLDGRRVYISRGVGMERLQAPRIRFLVPPEVSLLTFETASR